MAFLLRQPTNVGTDKNTVFSHRASGLPVESIMTFLPREPPRTDSTQRRDSTLSVPYSMEEACMEEEDDRTKLLKNALDAVRKLHAAAVPDTE